MTFTQPPLPKKKPQPYDLTTHGGKTVDWHTKMALRKAERIVGRNIAVTQGCWQDLDGAANDVSASAGTHGKGGVVDVPATFWQQDVRALRLSGIIAYFRPKLVRDGKVIWNDHIHGVLEACARLSPEARQQVNEYHLGGDGLVGSNRDPHYGMRFVGFPWPYHGLAGTVRWKRDRLRGKPRRQFVGRVKKALGL
jgi:hypothetical protein